MFQSFFLSKFRYILHSLEPRKMRIFNRWRGVIGSRTLFENGLRFRYMITEQAKERCRVLAFWKCHGTKATEEAFNIKNERFFCGKAI